MEGKASSFFLQHNFGSNDNLTNINNFAGQRDIEIELTAINDKNMV